MAALEEKRPSFSDELPSDAEIKDVDASSGPSSSPEPTPAPAPPAQSPIPNGGLTAWLQVLGAFFLFFNSW
jgi:hypothetical protein